MSEGAQAGLSPQNALDLQGELTNLYSDMEKKYPGEVHVGPTGYEGLPKGRAQYQQLLDGGFPRPEADAWRASETAKLQSGGFTQREIDDYWGDGVKPTPGLDAQVAGNVQHNWDPAQADTAKGPLDYLAAGWDMSTASLGLVGPPKTIMPEHAGMMADILYGIGQFAGDAPASVAGFLGGAGALAETGPVGASVAGYAGSAALPEAMRQVLMDHYKNGDILTFGDFVSRSSSMAWETAKAGVVGGVAGPLGKVAGGKVLERTASQALATTAEATTFAASATAAGGALNGRVPDAQDFGTAVAIMLGAHVAFNSVGVTKRMVLTKRGDQVAENMRNIYVKTGLTPWEQAQRANSDPVIRQELLAHDADGNPVTPKLTALAPPPPAPYREPGKAIEQIEAPDTRGQGQQYHGTPQPITALDNSYYNEHNIYGATGFYTTDATDIAKGYQRKSPNGQTYAVSEIAPVKMFDMEQKRTPEEWAKALPEMSQQDGLFAGAVEQLGPKASLREIMDEMRAESANEGMSKIDTQELFDHMTEQLHSQGFGGMQHVGGAQTKKRPHQVKIYFRPQDQVRLTPQGEARPDLSTDEQLSLITKLEGSGDSAVSPAGAIGRFQIMPGTAKQYGFNPDGLTNPAYGAKVAKAILEDLTKRYRKPDGTVDQEAVLIAYNAGPGRANQFRADGRQFSKLPVETQRYLEHADRLGGFGGGKEPPPPAGGTSGVADGGEPPKPTDDPFKLNSEMLADRINQITAEPTQPSFVDRMKDIPNRAYFEAVSELAPFKKVDKLLDLGENDVSVEDMFRSTYASAGRADHFIRWGTLTPLAIDETGKIEQFKKTSDDYLFKGYEQAKAQGVSAGEVVAYRRALRTVELSKRGIETPTDLKDAQAMIEKVGGKLKPIAELFDRVNDAKIDYMRDSGLISAKQADAVKEQNRYWIPYNPAKEGGYGATGSRFGPTNPLKKIKGGKYETVDPVPQEVTSFHNAIANADKNRATYSLMKALTPEAKKTIGLKEITDQRTKPELFDKYGNPVPAYEAPLGPLNENQFAYFDSGTRKVMQVDDPMLARAIRGASPMEAGTLLKTLRLFAQIKRTGIVEMPDYIARALAKDMVAAKVLEKWGGANLAQIWEAGMHVAKVDKVFQDYVAKGGLGTALADMDANYVARDVYKLFEETGTWNRVVNTVRHPLQAVGLMMQRVDAVMRLAEVGKQKAGGVDPFKATMRARKINLDFAEKGADPLINVMASIVPFFRPNMLGLDQLGRALKTNPLSVALKGVTYMSTPIALLYAMNYLQEQGDPTIPDDAKWANLPRWQKDTMFILPRVAGVRLRLPMPPVLGPLFGGLTNRVLDHFAESDPHAFDQWANTMWAQFMPPILPAVALPIYEHVANQNAFTGRPLIPASVEGASGYMQYVDYTSETAKRVAQWIGPPGVNLADVSPIVLENYVREWTGPMGQQVLRLVDGSIFPKTGKPWEFADIPVIGAFTVRNPGMGAQPIADFYDGLDEVMKHNKDLSLAIKRQDIGEIDTVSANAMAFVKLNGIADALSTQRGAIDAINRNEDMTTDDKRQALETIYSAMIAESKSGLEVIDTVRGAQ